jgi:hypothetical protein
VDSKGTNVINQGIQKTREEYPSVSIVEKTSELNQMAAKVPSYSPPQAYNLSISRIP